MKRNIFIAVILMVSVVYLQACNSADSKSEKNSDSTTTDASATDHANHGSGNEAYDQMMKKMMDDMNAVQMTGDFDVDFAKMMIPHHQSAVDMSEMYLPKLTDEKTISIAQSIITTQKKEIEELKTLIANHKPAEKKEESAGGHAGGTHNELMQAMNKMMDRMKQVQMNGNADREFVELMLPHHQSAIEMAENEMTHGKNVQIKQFAQKVVNDQSKEIAEFETWLKVNQ